MTGYRSIHKFDNGYEASVVCGPGTYGNAEGLFEVAVKHNGSIVYDTPITSDVLGWLTFREVADTLDAIAALPARACV